MEVLQIQGPLTLLARALDCNLILGTDAGRIIVLNHDEGKPFPEFKEAIKGTISGHPLEQLVSVPRALRPITAPAYDPMIAERDVEEIVAKAVVITVPYRKDTFQVMLTMGYGPLSKQWVVWDNKRFTK